VSLKSDPKPEAGLRARIEWSVPGLAMFRGYSVPSLRLDAIAALSLWAVVIPQALAYGELAGVPAVAGLYTALAGMLLYGLFASSRYLNVGPESSVAIVVAASVASLSNGDPNRAIELTAMLAILTGAWLVVGAIVRLGFITRLLSTPILAAYLTGSAIIIIASQIPKIFGISVDAEQWWAKITGVLTHLGETNAWALAIGVGTIVVVVLLQRSAKGLPAFLIAMAISTLIVALADLASTHDVAVVGHISRGIPIPSFPQVSLKDTFELLVPAASIALLVFASSIATASALASRDKEDLSPTREFFGLAAAGVGAGLLRGFPANGSDSRSFIVANSGRRSQSVNIIGAVAVAVTLIALTPLFQDLPIAALGGVVLVSAVKLIDVVGLHRLWRVRRSDFVLAIITFAGVLVVGVLGGIVVGVVVSLLETLRRAIVPSTAVLGQVGPSFTYRDITHYEDAATVPGLVVYRFDAPLFFANAELFRDQIRDLVRSADTPVRRLVVSAEGITDMDVTGAEALGRVSQEMRDLGVNLVLARLRTHVRQTLEILGLDTEIGSENIFLTVADATRDFVPHDGRRWRNDEPPTKE
jgi:sulfate permease, SulP family